MKFILRRNALRGHLRALAAGGGKRRAPNSLLRLTAQDGRIVFQTECAEAGCEALVLEEGVCFFRYGQFLPLVRTYAGSVDPTVEVTPDGIEIGNTKISRGLWEVSLFKNPNTAPATLNATPLPEKESDDGQREFGFGSL